MNNFDKVIGYETIKKELIKVCDMIKNKEVYNALGAKMPNGILLYGDPGLGKTLMAKCFIEECKLEAFIIRRNKSEDFVGYIIETFNKAKENAPSVVFLDDLDKFANEDSSRCDAEEYVAVQAGIDEVKGSGVFVLATVNEMNKLPSSLVRAGRFDKNIRVLSPNRDDCMKIIKHYLSDKKLASDVNVEDLVNMISYNSCAELETILNEAAILAGFNRKKSIEMTDLVNAVLRMEYDAPDDFTKVSDEEIERIAVHEAGHLIMSEILLEGSVGIASLRKRGRDEVGGFVRRCKKLPTVADDILVSLAGKAAVESEFGAYSSGCDMDINRAARAIRDEISENGGFGFGMIDVANSRFPESSESFNSRNEAVTQAELERYMFKAREAIVRNKDFLIKIKEALIEKQTLLSSDIARLRKETKIVEVCLW